MSDLRPRPSSVIALLAFVGLAALFFWRLWAPNAADVMVIGAPDGDFLRQFYPYRAFVARSWAGGHLPTWNPHQYGGTPAWADPQQAVVYPWRLVQVPLALGGRTLPLWAVELEAVAHVALGGWLVYLLLRRLRAEPLAAAVGGAVFAFGGYLTGYPVEQLAVLDSAVWIAAIAAALAVAIDAASHGDRQRSVRGVLAAAAATGLAALGGHPQTAVYGVYVALAWFAYLVWSRRPGWRPVLPLLLLWLGMAAGVAAIQWVPSADLLRRADRTLPAEELEAGFVPADILQVVVAPPQRTPDADPAGTVSAAQIVWAPLFVGGLALLLALWGARYRVDGRFWLGAAAVAFLLALGGNGFLFPLAVKVVPGLALFRHQERFAVVVSLGIATAAGLGLGQAMGSGRTAYRQLGRWALAAAGVAAMAAAFLVVTGRSTQAVSADGVASCALFLAIGGLALVAGGSGRLSSRATTVALVTVIVIELFSANRGRALTTWADPFVPDTITMALMERSRDGRAATEGLLPGGPNAASVYDLQDLTGDIVLRPKTVGRLAAMPEIVRWRLLAARYAVSDRAFEPGAPVQPMMTEDGRTLYEVQLPAPYAWVVRRTEPLSEEALADWEPPPQYDPLADPVPVPGGSAEDRPATDGAETADAEVRIDAAPVDQDSSARLTALEPGRAVVEADLAAPGRLVFSCVYDDGWRARAEPRVDRITGDASDPNGPEAVGAVAVVPAYGVLPSVSLPAGAWRVEWTYRPRALHLGAALFGASLLFGALVWRRWPTRPA